MSNVSEHIKTAICEQCGKQFSYDDRVSKGRFCNKACRYAAHSRIIKESYTPELRKKHSDATKKQMQDPEQIKIRKEKCSFKRTSEQNLRNSVAQRKHIDYRSIGIDTYGMICQRCGKDLSNDLSELVVHHKDINHYVTDVNEIEDNSAENLMVLCRSCHTKLHSEIRKMSNRFTGQWHFENAANEILAGLKQMGFQIDRPNFKDTPKRFARAYFEIFEGVVNTEKEIGNILSTTFPANGDDTMVIAKDIVCFSMCPHHLLPVEYHVCVGYIPNKDGQVLGISKLVRLVELLSKSPKLQETFTNDIVKHLTDIGVYGAVALVEGQHMCMRMRGVKSTPSTITTTAVSGIFADDRSSKNEFLSNIADRKRFN